MSRYMDQPDTAEDREPGHVDAAYIRTNSLRSSGSMSFSSQEEAIKTFAAEQAIAPLTLVADVGISANSDKKPALDELLELGKVGRLRTLILAEWTRFSRDREKASELAARFRSYGVHVLLLRGDQLRP